MDGQVLKCLLSLSLNIDFNACDQNITDLHNGTIVVLSSLISSASKDNFVVIYDFAKEIFSSVEKSILSIMSAQEQIKNNIEVEQNTAFLEKMFSLHDNLISVLASFYEGDTKYFDQEQNEKALDYVIRTFELRGLFIEGISFINSFYSILRKSGAPYLVKVRPILLAALDSYMNFEICQFALSCISCILLELEENAYFIIDEVAIKCFNILQVSFC